MVSLDPFCLRVASGLLRLQQWGRRPLRPDRAYLATLTASRCRAQDRQRVMPFRAGPTIWAEFRGEPSPHSCAMAASLGRVYAPGRNFWGRSR